MKDIIKRIEKATNCDAMVLSDKELGTGKRYQIALISDKYGVELFLSIVYACNDKGGFWYIDDVCQVLRVSYCIFEYTIDKIKEVLKQCGQSK